MIHGFMRPLRAAANAAASRLAGSARTARRPSGAAARSSGWAALAATRAVQRRRTDAAPRPTGERRWCWRARKELLRLQRRAAGRPSGAGPKLRAACIADGRLGLAGAGGPAGLAERGVG